MLNRITFLLFCAVLFFQSFGYSQGVTIGSGNAPHKSSILDLQSTNKGFLPPRLTAVQRKAIPSPAAGLVVFDTDNRQLFLFDGSQWLPLSAGSASNSITAAQQSLPAAELKTAGYFGADVAINETYAVIGAPRADSGTKLSAGAFYVYKKLNTGAWTQVAKKFASDPQEQAYFGMSVAISGNYIVASAPGYKSGTFYAAGKVYVFLKGAADTWTLQTSFTRATPAAAEYFGFNVTVSAVTTGGPVIIATAPYSGTGIAEVYQYTNRIWNYLQTLKPADLRTGDQFGFEVDIDKDYCVVSAPSQDNLTYNYTDAGAAYVFVYGGGAWAQQFKLAGTTAKSLFGFSVCIRGNLIVATAPMAPPYTNTTAAVYLYERRTTDWAMLTYIFLYNQQGYDGTNWLGISATLDNSYLMVSMPGGVLYHSGGSSYYSFKAGTVLVYKKNPEGNYFNLHKVINDNEAIAISSNQNFFGNSVGMKNGNYIIGIPYKNVNGVSGAGTVAFGFIE